MICLNVPQRERNTPLAPPRQSRKAERGMKLLAFLLVSAGLVAAAQPAPLARVPMRYLPPTLVVAARVDASSPLLFAFDTGTTTCLLDARVAARLGIEPRQRVERGRRTFTFARAHTIAVGRAVAHDLELVLTDLSPLSQQLGVELAGILGYTWMEQFILEIDYAGGQLTLWPRQVEISPAADMLPVPLEIHTGPGFTGAALFVPGQLNGGIACKFEIDTGAEVGILGAAVARRLGAELGPGRRPHSVRTLTLGGRLFANVSFLVDPERGADGNPYLQCVIGNAQLKEFVLTLDIPHRRAFFRPQLAPAQPRQ